MAFSYDELVALVKHQELALKQKDKALKQKDKALKQKDKALKKVTWDLNMLPPYGKHCGSTSSTSIPVHHKEALFDEQVFNIIPDLHLQPVVGSSLQTLIKADGTLGPYASEADVQKWVSATFLDIIKSLGLDTELSIHEQLQLFRTVPDIWVLKSKTGYPVGFCECKKPPRKDPAAVLNNAHILGQMYDSLKILQEFHGLDAVFGIFTSYSHWRVCWLPSQKATEIANDQIDSEDIVIDFSDDDLFENDVLISLENDDQCDSSAAPENFVEDRLIYGTRLYEYTDSDTIPLIASVIRKMRRCKPSGKRKNLNSAKIYVTNDSWYWVHEKVSFSTLTSISHDSDTNSFYLLEDLGGGGDGRAWMACTRTGGLCVLKWFDNPEVVATEVIKFNAVNTGLKFQARAVTLNHQPVLLMPYVKILSQEELELPSSKEQIRLMFNNLALAGIAYSDVKPEHIGTCTPKKRGSNKKYVLIDTSRVTQNAEEHQISSMLNEVETLFESVKMP
jgi:hypothetical protein